MLFAGILLSPVPVYRQLISLYTLLQNPNMTSLGMSDLPVLPPLWARCDGSDPQHTCWIGAEPLKAGNKVPGLNIYLVSCDGKVLMVRRKLNEEG